MAGWGFWALALCLAGAVVAVLVASLRRGQAAAEPVSAAEADIAVYKDQLAEIERDLSRGTIGPEEAGRLRAEVGRRVIEADRVRKAGGTAMPSGASLPFALLIAALILPGGLAAYWSLGAPGYPDMALGPRLQALDAGIAGRPGQEAQLARLGTPRDAELDGRLETELVALTDPAALRALFQRRFEAGELQAAVRVQERLITVLGEASDANDHANLALALVVEAQGYVSPEAEAALREALRRDMTNELSRYLVGEMFLQGGRYDQAFRFWRPIAEGGIPGAPWVASIRERIEMVAELAGERYSLPEAAAPGPSAEDMAAAEEMTPEDRQAMIEGMVAQLSDRLATEGGTVEDWNRLIRSLAVLERLDEAQVIYDEAKVRFEGQPAELSFLRLAAVETGLNP
jgi:cytochrome c-type biogenesis protein CcmH